MGTRVHIVMSEGLLSRVDAVLGPGQSRGDWVRRAVERALDERGTPTPVAPGFVVGEPASSPAPAEQPEVVTARPESFSPVVASQVREFRPYPKSGKR